MAKPGSFVPDRGEGLLQIAKASHIMPEGL